MSIALIGDIHGDFAALRMVAQQAPEDATLLQVGDFGFWPGFERRWKPLDRPVYFLDGNHDYIPGLISLTEPTEVWPGAIYVPRSTVMELGGFRVLCMGGAKSCDRAWREKNGLRHGWFEEEQVRVEDVERARLAGYPDLIVTHMPGCVTIAKNFERPGFLRAFGLPQDWRDESSHAVQRVLDVFPGIPHFAGHMHRSVIDGRTRLLDINEVVVWAGSAPPGNGTA